MRILGYDFNVVEVLIGLNVLVFFISLLNYDYFITNYSLIPALVSRHPWTIVTSMFLHGDFNHIIFNMFSLYFFGLYLGSIIGEKELLKVYFAGGILGGLFFVLSAFIGLTYRIPFPFSAFIQMPALLTAAVGASGAIFALGAALAVLRPSMKVFIFPIPFPMPLYLAVFVFMFLLSFLPGIAWPGHFGGLAAGILFGYWYKRKEPFTGHMYGAYDRGGY
jgi:membrane associated rhomboid family serine protease